MNKDLDWLKWVGLFTVISIVVAVFYLKSQSKNQESDKIQSTQVIDNSPQPMEDVQNALDFVQKQKEMAITYKASDPVVRLDMLKFSAIVRTIYPNYGVKNDIGTNGIFQFTASDNGQFVPFHRFDDWISIKLSKNKSNDNLSFMSVELYNKKSYEDSKRDAFELCKNIWSNIDHRVPAVIDELADRLVKYENSGSSAMTQHIRYGYRFDLDARHYYEGYPVVCGVGYD